MLSRKLPNTNAQRLKALTKASWVLKQPKSEWIISEELGDRTINQAQAFADDMKAMNLLRGHRITANRKKVTARNLARMYANHFMASYFNAVRRGEIPASENSYFMLSEEERNLQLVGGDFELQQSIEFIIEAEKSRQNDGCVPVVGPDLRSMQEAYDAYLKLHEEHIDHKSRYQEAQLDFVEKIPALDEFIAYLWNSIYTELAKEEASTRRRLSRAYGVEYRTYESGADNTADELLEGGPGDPQVDAEPSDQESPPANDAGGETSA